MEELTCRIIDFFKTSIGDFYVVEFSKENFGNPLELKLCYADCLFEVVTCSWRSYAIDGKDNLLTVCGLKLKETNNKEFELPKGAVLKVIGG